MAPTKNVSRLPQKVAKKRPGKTNPVKAPLKTPAVIKMKIANLVALEQLTNVTEPKVTLSPIVPLPIKTEPQTEAKAKPSPKLKRKLPIKTQEADEPVKKIAKPECKKRGRKPAVKAVETSQSKSPPKPCNIQSDSEPESWQVITKQPGPKSRITVPIATGPVEEIKTETPITPVQKVKSAKAKTEPARIRQQKLTDPDESDETPQTTKRSKKKKQTQKKPVIEDTKKTEAAKQPKGRTRNKFVTERLNKHTKVTRSKGKLLNMKDIKSAASILDNALKGPANVKTRSNSVNSSNSNLSWTRDISTASSLSETTTCVTVGSNDFVRFDNKLPFVQIANNVDQSKFLKNVNDKLLEDSSSSESDSESSDSSSDSELDVSNKPDLNLSTSSLTAKSPQYEDSSGNTKLICAEMDKLTNTLKNFYSEMGRWLDFNDDPDTFSTQLENMSLEKEVITNCENLSSMLGNVCAQKSSPEKLSESSNNVRETNENDHQDEENPNQENLPTNIPTSSPAKSTQSTSTFTSDNYNYVSFDERNCEDEDALSLYAESMTGIESSRISSASNISIQEHIPKPIHRIQDPNETYIPKPTRPWLFERYNYLPTRIEKEKKREDVPLKTIEPSMVKKQNADSSSIKETNLSRKAIDLIEDANKLSELATISIKNNEEVNKPRRIFSQYQPQQDIKSALYRGYCFFFMAYQCKNQNCRFPHTDIEPGLLNCRLALLTDESIIEEYLLMVKSKHLRRKFGLLFMKECARRNATRILLEMSIDLGLGVVERANSVLNVNALETTLLHLNSTSFSKYDDLLTFECNDTMLCDALLRCMALSQNFSQFKRVFVKLSQYMEKIKRSVDIEIVGNILERVCILPCEESIARAMLSLMKNTDARIFENNMTKSFEFQLFNTNSNVYEQYLLAKKAAVEALLTLEENPTTSESSVPRVGREGPRNPSPDTTNLDSLKKAQISQPTTFKRTIDTDAIRHLFKSPSSPAPKPRFSAPRQWHRGTGFMQPPIPVRKLGNRRIYMNPTNHRNRSNT